MEYEIRNVNGRLRLEKLREVVTSNILVSSSYAKTGFISLSLAVYQFLVHDVGKKIYKIHNGIEKTTRF